MGIALFVRNSALSLLSLTAVLLGLVPASAEKRVALVIGNSAYRHATELTNPGHDAADIAAVLMSLNFTLVGDRAHLDLDKFAMDRVVREFSEMLVGADVGLFFYAGHGLQVAGLNYMVPIDARLKTAADTDFELVRLDLVQRQMERETNTNVLFLDACRNNPFARNLAKAMGERSGEVGRGLANAKAGVGTLISFATQPDNISYDGSGRNSPFTTALLKHIMAPEDLTGILISVRNDVRKATLGQQVPWETSALTGRLYFRQTQPPATIAPPLPVQPAIGTFPPPAIKVTPLSLERERALKPKDSFKECDVCPEMIVVPEGSFTKGSPVSEPQRSSDEGPQHQITIARSFAVGKFSVTFDEWDACVIDGGCNTYRPSDEGWGRGKRPVINVSWNDAKTYLSWLSRKTGKIYRLLSESEREYVTRAGTTTSFWWDWTISTRQANYDGNYVYAGGSKGEYRRQTVVVDLLQPNPWGLYQVHGNIWEWVEDCWNSSYNGAPADGSAWTGGDCGRRVLRGGSWNNYPWYLRSASRYYGNPTNRIVNYVGFRIARTLVTP